MASALGVGIASQVGSHQSGPPNATGTSDTGVAGSVPPGSTDLQALRQDFGPWRQLTGPATGSPALLLQDGGVYASQRWTVPSTATWWTADLGGNVINQAFIISGNPDTVLLITPGGTVMSMPLAQATAVRQPLRK